MAFLDNFKRGSLPKRGAFPLPKAGGRVSKPPVDNNLWDDTLKVSGHHQVVKKPFVDKYIPLIRSLNMMNGDVSQALWNIVSLGNTGHKIHFDPSVSEDQQEKMRKHILNRPKPWMSGQAGVDGMVNKKFYQLLISGALSSEWVPEVDLSGVATNLLVGPEEIEFVLSRDGLTYEPYQRSSLYNPTSISKGGLIKLNPNTYRYFALNGDTENPYGIPPYIPAIEDIYTQHLMKTNIRHIVEQLGLVGFLTVLLENPDQLPGETNDQYFARTEKYLTDTQQRLKDGMRDGIVVGYKPDVEFETSSISRAYADALELYKNNESSIATGMKQDPTLWGRDYNTSETQITVVFMKMISELRNFQNLIATDLAFGYSLDLRLAGFQFDYLTVKFKPSTLGDDLKIQQAEEIKIRNVERKMLLGIISQDQAADELGYDKPFEPEPKVDWETLAGGKSQAELEIASEKREAGKDASDKKNRKKNKPTGGKDK